MSRYRFFVACAASGTQLMTAARTEAIGRLDCNATLAAKLTDGGWRWRCGRNTHLHGHIAHFHFHRLQAHLHISHLHGLHGLHWLDRRHHGWHLGWAIKLLHLHLLGIAKCRYAAQHSDATALNLHEIFALRSFQLHNHAIGYAKHLWLGRPTSSLDTLSSLLLLSPAAVR